MSAVSLAKKYQQVEKAGTYKLKPTLFIKLSIINLI